MVGGDVGYMYNMIQNDVSELGNTMFIHLINNQVCGFIKGQLAPLPKYVDFAKGLTAAKIDWIYVCRWNHRQGIGSQLLAAYSDYMKDNGAQYLHLYAAPSEQSKKFWREKHGFEVIGWNNLMGKAL
jgi:ribosomal protein S18 acetylase RimI-like enzyme